VTIKLPVLKWRLRKSKKIDQLYPGLKTYASV